MIILVPILSYMGAVILVDLNIVESWVPSPAVLMQTVTIPIVDVPVLHLYANLVATESFNSYLLCRADGIVCTRIQHGGPAKLGPFGRGEPVRRPPRQYYKLHR